MACSDNVVRAGLTIKHRDKDTLCNMLTYNTRSSEENKFAPRPHPLAPSVQVYDPPTPEFAVARVSVPQGCGEFSLPAVAGMCGEGGGGGRGVTLLHQCLQWLGSLSPRGVGSLVFQLWQVRVYV